MTVGMKKVKKLEISFLMSQLLQVVKFFVSPLILLQIRDSI